MRGNYEYVVYYGLWLAKVNVLSILPWDKIINFFFTYVLCPANTGVYLFQYQDWSIQDLNVFAHARDNELWTFWLC
jgi:hypothetical protein